MTDFRTQILAAAAALSDTDTPEAQRAEQAEQALATIRLDAHEADKRRLYLSLWRRALLSRAPTPTGIERALDQIEAVIDKPEAIWAAKEPLDALERRLGPPPAAAIAGLALWPETRDADHRFFPQLFELLCRGGDPDRVARAWRGFLAHRPDYTPGHWTHEAAIRGRDWQARPDLEQAVQAELQELGRRDLLPLAQIQLAFMRQGSLDWICERAAALTEASHRRALAEHQLGGAYAPEDADQIDALTRLLEPETPGGAAGRALIEARLATARGDWPRVLDAVDRARRPAAIALPALALSANAKARLGRHAAARRDLGRIRRAHDAPPYLIGRAKLVGALAAQLEAGGPPPDAEAHPDWPVVSGRPLAQSLWVGPRLRWVERLSIASYLRNGWRYQLYVYDRPEGVPDGCEILDAEAILPRAELFHEGARSGRHRGSLGAFSDLFRYALLHRRGGMWTDTDVINRRRFEPDGRRFLSTELVDAGLYGPNGALMAAPAGAPFMAEALRRAREIVAADALTFAKIGPELLAEMIAERGPGGMTLLPRTFMNPIPWMRAARLLDPWEAVEARPEIQAAANIHLYTETWRLIGLRLDAPPGPETFLGRLYRDALGEPEPAPSPVAKATTKTKTKTKANAEAGTATETGVETEDDGEADHAREADKAAANPRGGRRGGAPLPLSAVFDPLGRALRDAGQTPLPALPETVPDLEELIARSRSPATLRALLTRMESAGLPDWALRAARRLAVLSPGAAAVAALIKTLTATLALDEARALSDAHSPAIREHHAVRHAEIGLLVAESRPDDAVALLRDLERDAADLVGPQDWARIAEAASRRGRPEDALAWTSEAAARWPDDPRLRAARIQATYLAGAPEQALADAAEARAEGDDPGRHVASVEVAILTDQGLYHRALNLIDALFEQDPSATGLLYQAHQIAALAGRLEDYRRWSEAYRRQAGGAPHELALLAIEDAEAGDRRGADARLARLRTLSEAQWLEARVQTAASDPKGRIEDVVAAYEACAAAPLRLDRAAVSLAVNLYYFDGRPAAIAQALTLIEERLERSRDQSSVLLLHLRLLIAHGRFEEARAAFDRLPPGLRGAKPFRIVELMFAARDGAHEAAKTGWTRLLADSRDQSLNMPASYPETIALKWRETPGAILLFGVIYNGVEYVDWLLQHYRALGVDHFFFTDNGSTDGTLERLESQPDVSLFQALDSFAGAGCGLLWTNHLISRFGVGRWCVHVDMDEALVFPGMEEGRDLRELTRYLDAQGYETTRSLMLDIFPERLDAEAADPFQASCWIDAEHYRVPSDYPPYETVYGGVRSRLTGRSVLLNKAPLAKVDDRLRYLVTNHCHTHAPAADLSTALLHYKFIGDLQGRMDDAIARGEHFLDAIHYKALRASLARAAGDLRDLGATRYTGPQQLVDLGVMDDSSIWRSRRW